jgi:VWFA-related protein
MRIGSGLTAALFLACATSHTLSGQQPASPTPSIDATTTQPQKSEAEPKTEVSVQDTGTTFKLRVNLVQVHVIVRDSSGKLVEGLRKEDFQLYDGGKPQAISTFSVENAQSRKERTEAAAKAQESGGESAAEGSVALQERFVALTFDDVHLKMGDAVSVRVAAERFLDVMSPGDRVGIFSTSGQLTQDFTGDKEALKQKLLGLLPRGRLSSSTTECPPISYYMADLLEKEGIPAHDEPGPPDFQLVVQDTLRCDPGIDLLTARILVESAIRRVLDVGEAENRDTFRQLESVLRILSAKPGERTLLLASPGFPLARLYFEESEVVDHANRANIVINALDARGLYALEPGGDIAQRSSDAPSTVGLKSSLQIAEELDQQYVLMDFAYGTGGTFFHNSNDLEGGLKLLGSVAGVSYVLGFSPQNQKMDGKYHPLKVGLMEKQKYAIQARRGYFAAQKANDPTEITKQEIQEAIFSQNEIDELPLSLQTQYFKTGDTESRLSVLSHLDVKRMQFHKAEGRNFNNVTVATVIFDDNGKFIMGGEKLVKMRLLDSSIERYGHTGFVVKSTFDLKPGKYMVRQVVRDSEGAQMAAQSATVVIPN